MNEGRDVWSGGNMSEKGVQVNKSLRRGLDIHRGFELFPKKVRASEVDGDLAAIGEAQEYVDKERRLRAVGGPFASGEAVEKSIDLDKEGKFREELHPRRSGKFAPKGSASVGAKKPEAKKVGHMGIQDPNSSGQGFHPDHDKHPYHQALTDAGFKYSHSVTVVHPGGDRVLHHAYGGPGDLDVGVHQALDGGNWMWEGEKGGSGRMTNGGDAESLGEYLKRGKRSVGKGVDGGEPFGKEWLAGVVGDIEKAASPFVVSPSEGPGREGRVSKDEIEKVLKDAGWDKLPIPDKAKEALEDLISNGARPASEYTGKIMVEHGVAEEPPSFVRPKKISVGDTVIPLDWRGVCLQGAKFDMPYVPKAAKVKKVYMGPVKVSKNPYPFGRMPSDISKVETVTEDRMWGLDLEGDEVGKDDDTFPSTFPTRDTTMVLRMEALASPGGEVNPGEMQPR